MFLANDKGRRVSSNRLKTRWRISACSELWYSHGVSTSEKARHKNDSPLPQILHKFLIIREMTMKRILGAGLCVLAIFFGERWLSDQGHGEESKDDKWPRRHQLHVSWQVMY